MTRLLTICLCFGLAACAASSAPDVASQPTEQPGATSYHMAHGALVGCTKTGFDIICR
jgi:hypothetical protein